MLNRLFSLILVLLSVSTATAQTPIFTNRSQVVELPQVTSEKKELIKTLKKNYRFSSATAEKWIDGETYIVARQGKNYTLFSLDGKPLLVYNNEVQWFPGINCHMYKGQPLLVLYERPWNSSNKGFATPHKGIMLMPAMGQDDYKFLTFGDKNYAAVMKNLKKWPDEGSLVSLDGDVIFQTDKNNWVSGMHFNPESDGVFYVNYLKMDNSKWGGTLVKTIKGKVLNEYPGQYFPLADGYGMMYSRGSSFRSDSVNTNGVLSIWGKLDYATNKGKLLAANGELILDSISSVVYYPEAKAFVYNKLNGKEMRVGLKSMDNPSLNVNPQFSEISLACSTDGWKVLVRPTLLALQEEYIPSKTYTRTYASEAERLLEYANSDSVFTVYKDADWENLQPNELIALARASFKTYDRIASSQNFLLRHYDTPDRIDETTKMATSMFERSTPTNFNAPSATIHNSILALRGKNDKDCSEAADDIERQNNILLGSLILMRDSIIPAAKERFMVESQALTDHHNQIMEESARKKAELEQQRRREIIESWTASAREGLAKHNAKMAAKQAAARQKASTTKAGTGVSGGGAGSSSAKSEYTGNSKGFLKGKVIEWENKLKRAVASHEEALRIADSVGTWEAKAAAKSKENTMNDIASELAKYKAQLAAAE